MSDRTTEDIIGALYDLVQDARSMPLAADKCILERDKVLDMLDEIIAQLPVELKQSRTIVESRNELISQARREAEVILREAQEKASKMVTKEAVYEEAKKRSEELVGQTQEKINQLRKAANAYMDESLRQTEEVISNALSEVRDTRMKFRAVTEAQEQNIATSIPVGISWGLTLGCSIILLGSITIAKLLDTQVIQWNQAGYWIMFMLLTASFSGAQITAGKIKRKYLQISFVFGFVLWVILLGLTAIFFGGQYSGAAVTAGLIITGSICAGLLHQTRNNKTSKKKTKYKRS